VATPGQLCAKTAELLGFEPNTTTIAWRALREGSHVTTGGRGRSAAHCVPADAANLLIATIGKLPLKSYLKSWERFSNLAERDETPRSRREEVPVTDEFRALGSGHLFKDGLEALLRSAMSGSLHAFFEDALDPDEIVRLGGIRIRFIGPYPQAFINIHKNNEKRSAGLRLSYSDIPTEMGDIIDWSEKARPPDKSGDLTQIMEISGRTIFSLGEFLRLDRRSE
jgi:hypothetical protein